MILPFVISILAYIIAIRVVFLTRLRFESAISYHNTKIVRSIFALGILLYLYIFLGLGSSYLKDVLAPDAYYSSLVLLIPTFIFVVLAWLPRKTILPWSFKRFDHHWRGKPLPTVRGIDLDRLLSPINSWLAFVIWLVLLICIPDVIRYLILVPVEGTVSPVGFDLYTRIPLLMETGVFASLVEEVGFRWFPMTIWGPTGLTLGTIIWFLSHPFKLWVYGILGWKLLINTSVWLLDLPFYIKLWRGKYFWLSFIVHTLNNFLIILLTDLFGLPG